MLKTGFLFFNIEKISKEISKFGIDKQLWSTPDSISFEDSEAWFILKSLNNEILDFN